MVGGGCCYVSTSKGMENKEKEGERGNLSVRVCQPRIRRFEYDVKKGSKKEPVEIRNFGVRIVRVAMKGEGVNE